MSRLWLFGSESRPRPAAVNVTGQGYASTGAPSMSHQIFGAPFLYLAVVITWVDSLGNSDQLAQVSYGGAPMTLIGGASASGNTCTIWGLVNPTVGTASITTGWDLETLKGGSIVAYTLRDVHQVTSVGSNFTATGTGTAPSLSVTGTHINSLVLDALCVHSGASSPSVTVGAGQTQRYNAGSGSAGIDLNVSASSTEPGNSGTATMSWTLGSSKTFEVAAVEFKAAVP